MKTFIFDFDGTLCDSYVESLRVMNELAPRFGYNVWDEARFDELRDMGFNEFQAAIGVSLHQLPAIVHEGRKRMRERVASLAPVAGLAEALAGLHERGASLGILTSNSLENVELFLERNRLGPFEFIHGGSSLFGKARHLRKILKSRKLLAADVAYVGDEARDVRAARSAGVTAVAVTWGFNSLRLLGETAPDHTLSHPRELVELGSRKR
ncbi:MAG: HAD-IA family hydrolase [Deltaproteobacteria bacterium]|nr:HAD-IA family hydrolase [Deltaproteobacteria bacterium]